MLNLKGLPTIGASDCSIIQTSFVDFGRCDQMKCKLCGDRVKDDYAAINHLARCHKDRAFWKKIIRTVFQSE